jgi:hypothetical protein
MASPNKSANRQRLVEAVRAPIAYFALALLVIEVILGLLASSGKVTPHAGEVMTYGMVGSLLLLLLGFLVALFSKPDVLFRSGPVDEAITGFRKLGDELSGNDFAVLKRMLGSPAGYFTDFASGIVAPGGRTIADREKKLAKLGFIQKVGSSEVALSPIGASFVQAIARHASEPAVAGFSRVPAVVQQAGEVSATDADLASFLRALDLNTVARLMIIANTGQETFRMVVDELQRLRNEQTFERLAIQILLRSPSLTDERRAENAGRTIANAQRLDSRSASTNAIVVEHRFYAGPIPLRCLLVEYTSGKHAGFLSYYDWHQRVQRRATSTRDAASKRAHCLRDRLSSSAGLLSLLVLAFLGCA